MDCRFLYEANRDLVRASRVKSPAESGRTLKSFASAAESSDCEFIIVNGQEEPMKYDHGYSSPLAMNNVCVYCMDIYGSIYTGEYTCLLLSGHDFCF